MKWGRNDEAAATFNRTSDKKGGVDLGLGNGSGLGKLDVIVDTSPNIESLNFIFFKEESPSTYP